MTDELLELERGFWDATGDGDYYMEHMAANGLCVLPVGVLDKDTTVEAISDADPWDEFEFSNVMMVDLGDDEAALCYRAEASHGTATNTLPSNRPCIPVSSGDGS